MSPDDLVLIMNVYHPKPGHEDLFIQLWREKIATLAIKMGSDYQGIYHNEDTDYLISITHWPKKSLADAFLSSYQLQEIIRELSPLCLIPIRLELFEILRDRAA